MAAVGIAHTHAWGYAHGRHHVGAAGVDVFFVISGFIVSLAARRHPQGFLANRLIRVLPMYYLASLPFLALACGSGDLDLRRLLASLTLWPAYDRYVTPYLDVGWSLSFELLFYLALAATLAGVRPALLLALYAACWAAALATGSTSLAFLGAPITLEFLMGVGVGMLTTPRPRWGAACLLGALAAFTAFAVLGTGGLEDRTIADPTAFRRVVLWGVPAALLVFGAIQLEPFARGPIVRVLGRLGDASYSLYLVHLPAMSLLVSLVPGLGATALVAGAVVISVGVHLGVERPVTAAVRALVRRPIAQPA